MLPIEHLPEEHPVPTTQDLDPKGPSPPMKSEEPVPKNLDREKPVNPETTQDSRDIPENPRPDVKQPRLYP